MIINLSNHPYHLWSKIQIDAAEKYGTLIDLPFPEIDPEASEQTIELTAGFFFNKIRDILKDSSEPENIVHLMGEMTFCFFLASLLLENGIPCVASTTNREVVENGFTKTSHFSFCRFRHYSHP